MDALADVTRDASGHPAGADAEGRALDLAWAVRNVLHVPTGEAQDWGGPPS